MSAENPRGSNSKPNLHKSLFWDWRYDDIDWQKSYVSIIGRVLERGTEEEWEELIRFYGLPTIITVLKSDLKYLPDYAINEVCEYFNLTQQELASWQRKQVRKGCWI